MSRKHNTKHRRSRSRYIERLRARGLSRTPQMTDYIGVARQQPGRSAPRAGS